MLLLLASSPLVSLYFPLSLSHNSLSPNQQAPANWSCSGDPQLPLFLPDGCTAPAPRPWPVGSSGHGAPPPPGRRCLLALAAVAQHPQPRPLASTPPTASHGAPLDSSTNAAEAAASPVLPRSPERRRQLAPLGASSSPTDAGAPSASPPPPVSSRPCRASPFFLCVLRCIRMGVYGRVYEV